MLGRGLQLLTNWQYLLAGVVLLLASFGFGYIKGVDHQKIAEAKVEVKQVQKVAKIEQKQFQISEEQRNQYDLQKAHIVYLTKEVIKRVPAKAPLCPSIANVLERVRPNPDQGLPEVPTTSSGHEERPSSINPASQAITNGDAVINQGEAEKLEVEVLRWRAWYKEQCKVYKEMCDFNKE